MGHIFISYSHKDSDYAHALANSLQGMGFNVWIDARLDYGSHWPVEIEKQLDGCDAFILIMSPRSYASEWVQSELQRAKRKLKPILPLLLQGNEPWLSVESTQYYDVREGNLPDAKFYSSLKQVVSTSQNATTLGLSKKAISEAKPVVDSSASKVGNRTGIIVGVVAVLVVIFVACAGLVVGMRFLIPNLHLPSNSVTATDEIVPSLQATTTPEPTSTATSIPPSATIAPPTDIPGTHAPVIESVQLREDSSSGNLVIFQDIYFHDEDGDANQIDYTLIAGPPGAYVINGPIDIASGRQISGTSMTGTWKCGDVESKVILQVTILDEAGNRSNTMEYTMFCHK